MLAHLKSWWTVHATLIAAIIVFLSPSIQTYIGSNAKGAMAVGAVWAIILKLTKSPLASVVFLLALLLVATPAMAQTLPTPTTNTASFNIGAAAFGLGGAASATPASDVTLSLNPGFNNKYFKTLELRSDNLLAPGANLQYYGGGVNWVTPLKFASTSAFAPLSFYVDATAGVGRIVPASGATVSHVGFMAGGGLRWLTSSGVQVTLVEINVLHTPGAPWGSNAPAISGGLSYVFGKH